jgi:hypothetical protein
MKRLKKIYANIIASLIINKDKRSRIRKILLEGARRPLKRPWTPPKRTCDVIVSASGEGHSGSGAVVDFLREFDNCAVNGSIDENGIGPMGKALANNSDKVEFDVFRHHHGILGMEPYAAKGLLSNSNISSFLHLNERFYANNGGIYNDEYMRLVWDFIDEISTKSIIRYWDISYQSYCDEIGAFIPTNVIAPYLVYPQETGYAFNVRENIALNVYRQKAKSFLDKVFKTIESEKYLVLDQFVSPQVSDETISAYIPGLKRIHVYRDPRDCFATALLLDVPWLPHKAADYVNLYRNTRKRIEIGANKDVLYIRFEDLVLNYQESAKQIMDFLGLKEANHVHKKGFFDPEISKKNVGLYKKVDARSIELIEKELPDWIYKQ